MAGGAGEAAPRAPVGPRAGPLDGGGREWGRGQVWPRRRSARGPRQDAPSRPGPGAGPTRSGRGRLGGGGGAGAAGPALGLIARGTAPAPIVQMGRVRPVPAQSPLMSGKWPRSIPESKDLKSGSLGFEGEADCAQCLQTPGAGPLEEGVPGRRVWGSRSRGKDLRPSLSISFFFLFSF